MNAQPLEQIVVDSWKPINLNHLPEQPPIQPNLANTNLIYPGKRHVFSGPPESAKTLAAYAILIHNARAGNTGILIDFEMGGYDARQRLQELGATEEEISRILYLEPDERATPARVNQLVAHRPTLVVIDAAAGAYSLEGLNDNHRDEVEKFSQLYIAIFWRNAIATILIDHVVKNTLERGRYQIGSERKLGASDVHIGFDTIKAVSRGTSGHYKLIVHKDRGGYHKRGHLADLHLESDPDTHEIEWRFTDPAASTDDEGHFRPTHLMEKVSVDIELRTEPATRNDVCETLGGRKKYVLEAINALVREGFLTETDGPKRSKLLTHNQRYREANDQENLPNPPVDNSSGSAVPVWFRSSSGNQWQGGSSSGSPPYGGTSHRPPPPGTPQTSVWFPTDGPLSDSPDLTYLEQLYDNSEEPDA